jgi:hypothetical protein
VSDVRRVTGVPAPIVGDACRPRDAPLVGCVDLPPDRLCDCAGEGPKGAEQEMRSAVVKISFFMAEVDQWLR